MKSDYGLYKEAMENVDVSKVEEFEEQYGLSKRQMATLVGVSEKTYYNLLTNNKLDEDRSDRFLYLNKIFEEGKEAFFTEQNLSDWLNAPQPSLDGLRPIEMMSSINGAQAVYHEIGKIKYGVLS